MPSSLLQSPAHVSQAEPCTTVEVQRVVGEGDLNPFWQLPL